MGWIRALLSKWPLTSYIIITYVFSWAFLYPCYQILLNAEEGTFPLMALIGLPGAYGPSIIAILIVWVVNGREEVTTLLKKVLIFKVHFKWILFIFLFPVLIYALAVYSSMFFGFSIGQSDTSYGLKMALLYILLALPFGPMGEELGWRGYLLPELMKKYNPILSSLIIGIIWTFWHIASFTFPGAAIPSIFEVNFWTILMYLANTIAISFVFTLVFLNSRGSVFWAIILHAIFNASSSIVHAFYPDTGEQILQQTVIYISNFVLIFTISILILKFIRGARIN